MRIVSPLALFLAMGLTASSAFAQIADFRPFNGPYVGVQGGWQLDRLNLGADYGDGNVNVHRSNSGFAYGGQAGWDFQVAPRFVVGVEGSVTGVTGANYGTDDGGNTLVFSVGRTFDASGRVGYLLTPTSLVYGRGGWTNTQDHITDLDQTFHQDRDGYLVGAGYERALGRHLSARLEYDYSHFSDASLPTYAVDTGAVSALDSSNRHQVMLGVNYRF